MPINYYSVFKKIDREKIQIQLVSLHRWVCNFLDGGEFDWRHSFLTLLLLGILENFGNLLGAHPFFLMVVGLNFAKSHVHDNFQENE